MPSKRQGCRKEQQDEKNFRSDLASIAEQHPASNTEHQSISTEDVLQRRSTLDHLDSWQEVQETFFPWKPHAFPLYFPSLIIIQVSALGGPPTLKE